MVGAIMEAMADQLRRVPGLHAIDYEPDQVDSGMTWPTIVGIEYNQASTQGLKSMELEVTATTSRQNPKVAYERLYDLASPDTVDIIQGDRTLNGNCQDVHCHGSRIEHVQVGDEIYPAVIYQLTLLF